MLKEKTNKKDKKEIKWSKETITKKGKKTEEGKKHKVNRDETKFPEDSMESIVKITLCQTKKKKKTFR